MKTLILLFIGTLFGIWFYNHHSNLIPKSVTDNIDHSVEWIKGLWPERNPTPSSEKERTTPRITPSGIPGGEANTTAQSKHTQSASQATSPRRQAVPDTPDTPRDAAMESYTRTIRMIDENL